MLSASSIVTYTGFRWAWYVIKWKLKHDARTFAFSTVDNLTSWIWPTELWRATDNGTALPSPIRPSSWSNWQSLHWLLKYYSSWPIKRDTKDESVALISIAIGLNLVNVVLRLSLSETTVRGPSNETPIGIYRVNQHHCFIRVHPFGHRGLTFSILHFFWRSSTDTASIVCSSSRRANTGSSQDSFSGRTLAQVPMRWLVKRHGLNGFFYAASHNRRYRLYPLM